MTMENADTNTAVLDQLQQQQDDRTRSEIQKKSTINVKQECKLFFQLAGNEALGNILWVVSPLLTASYIGRNFAPVYLSAFTLANLTGNISLFCFLQGLMTATDTLSPQAYGKEQFEEVGRIAIRGFFTGTILLLPINVFLSFSLESIMVNYLGQDSEASMYAQQWYRIYGLGLPFSILYEVIWKFMTAQHVMKPLMIISTVSTCIVLPISLNYFIKYAGFLGSAYAYILFQMVQAISLVFFVFWKHPHDSRTWPVTMNTTRTHHNNNNNNNKSLYEFCKSSLQLNPTKEFLYLGLGGVFAQGEWIFWEAVGLVVGQLGVVALSVHTIPNQIIMASCLVSHSLGTALAIRMGVSLPVSVRRTKLIVIATTVFSTVLVGIISIGIYVCKNIIIALFSNDNDVKQLAGIIWTQVVLFNMNGGIFAILQGITTGLGRQWTLGIINFVFLWIIGLPIIYYKCIRLHGGLDDVWFWMNIPYLGMNITLVIVFICSDWYVIQKQINESDDDNDEADAEAEGSSSLLMTEDNGIDEKTTSLSLLI